jgi:hypothetical protein
MSSSLFVVPVAVVASVVALMGCGDKTINAGNAAESISASIFKQTKFQPTDMKCPSGVKATVGVTFDCHFTGPEGPYTAAVKILTIDGAKATFSINSTRDH